MNHQISAEILTIGDEILFGQITNTNAQWMSEQLSLLGIRVLHQTTIGDTATTIQNALQTAFERVNLVLITGGLGPTKDDITKKVLADFFDSEMQIHEEALTFLSAFFEKRGRELTELNRLQALLPVKCQYLPNRLGTAPGMWFEKEGKVFVAMPGVPFEMKALMTEQVIPRLKSYFKPPVIFHKMIRTIGIPESVLAARIEQWEDNLPPHIRLAYLPSPGQVKLRLTATGTQQETLCQEVQQQINAVLPLIERYVYGYDQDVIAQKVGEMLLQQGKTIATAESCTGGYIGHMITEIAGSSAYFLGGIISYSNTVKMQTLGVKPETLSQYGAVSEQTAKEMAIGVRNTLKSDVAIAATGIAGPSGGTEEKPVGTVWIAYSDAQKTVAKKLQLTQDRSLNIQLTGINALNWVRLCMLNIEQE
jgi:nicotinamide-nucleotide amidase